MVPRKPLKQRDSTSRGRKPSCCVSMHVRSEYLHARLTVSCKAYRQYTTHKRFTAAVQDCVAAVQDCVALCLSADVYVSHCCARAMPMVADKGNIPVLRRTSQRMRKGCLGRRYSGMLAQMYQHRHLQAHLLGSALQATASGGTYTRTHALRARGGV